MQSHGNKSTIATQKVTIGNLFAVHVRALQARPRCLGQVRVEIPELSRKAVRAQLSWALGLVAVQEPSQFELDQEEQLVQLVPQKYK
jgi:hypothetical protein